MPCKTYFEKHRYRPFGNGYECGLRSIGEFKISELAQYYGGGHTNAAGFSVAQATFLNFLDES